MPVRQDTGYRRPSFAPAHCRIRPRLHRPVGISYALQRDRPLCRRRQPLRRLRPSVTAFSQSLGSVSARDGIRVVAINPGPVETDRLVTLFRKKAQDRTGDPETWRDLVKPLPFARAASPEEIASAIAFLASNKSGYTSGCVVTIDAGISARAG